MFERLYEHPYALSRHQNGPLSEDRRRFLVYLAQRGESRSSLRSVASLLLRNGAVITSRSQVCGVGSAR